MTAPSDPLPPALRARDLPATTIQLARAVDGDADSLAWIVERLSPALRAYASYRIGRVLRQHHDPDDLVHDAWLAVLPKLRELVAGEDRRRTPVLLKYLSNTILFRIRDLARRHARGAHEPAAAAGEVPAAISGAVTRAFRREVRDELHRQLDELDERDREILLLRGIEQLSAKATATLLGLGVEATHKRYQRALARLRSRLPESIFVELDDG
ncbi:MAG: sigma-70 family RNA polymerase sigma factor [Planctomycetes bacterium]|nr:sigma-70 family RNA polymerase sigma factor [Planctomycetota bacterium]